MTVPWPSTEDPHPTGARCPDREILSTQTHCPQTLLCEGREEVAGS